MDLGFAPDPPTSGPSAGLIKKPLDEAGRAPIAPSGQGLGSSESPGTARLRSPSVCALAVRDSFTLIAMPGRQAFVFARHRRQRADSLPVRPRYVSSRAGVWLGPLVIGNNSASRRGDVL